MLAPAESDFAGFDVGLHLRGATCARVPRPPREGSAVGNIEFAGRTEFRKVDPPVPRQEQELSKTDSATSLSALSTSPTAQ